MDIDLGPFRLLERLASGGMGEVWRGIHREQDIPVAIKLIRAEMLDEQAEERFQREVWAQARLDHPAVVYLFDHGRLDASTAFALGMPTGAPWLAMEFCSSTLRDAATNLDWEGLRQVIVPLLGALAQAHSRGVLHRDIKLANVLMSSADDLRPGVKLADFGIAHVLADEDEITLAAGTPRYMAPEQVTGDWEQLGPWSDLYALGVLTWRLVTGRKPWADLEGTKLLLAMIHRELDWYPPRFAVPPGLQGWIARMTRKRSAERYQLAADALADFEALPRTTRNGLWVPRHTRVADDQDDDSELLRRKVIPNPTEEPPSSSETNIRMTAAGLGLLPMRMPQFIGRRIERRMMWDLLVRVSREGTPHAVALIGPSGVGRERFQHWFVEAAEGSGRAMCIWLDCVPGRPLGLQVLKALRAWFRVGAFERPDAIAHVQTWLGEVDGVEPFVDMLRNLETVPGWQDIVAQALGRLGRVRPVILQFGGCHGESELQGFVDALVSQRNTALLVVTDAPLQGAEPIELGPLDEASMSRLADALVTLDPAVRASLVNRSCGSPGYLIQSLHHWNRMGYLVPQPGGFGFSGDIDEVPVGLAIVAHSILASLAQVLDDASMHSLLTAAVIGQTVPIELWEQIDAPDPEGKRRRQLLSLLAAKELVEEQVGQFRFASVAFRRLLLQQHQPQLAPIHRACAEAIDPGRHLERARHLVQAGDVEAALEPLWTGIHRRLEYDGGTAALADTNLLERAVSQLEGPVRLRWQARLREVQAAIHLDLGNIEHAEQAANEVLRTAELFDDTPLLARCWAQMGAVAWHRGRLTARREAYARALELGTDVPAAMRASWWTALGTACLGLGDADGWREAMLHAGEAVHQDPSHESDFRIPLAHAVEAQLDGRVDEALELLSSSYAAAAEAGVSRGRLAVLRARAHTLLNAGRLEASMRAFIAALELAVAVRPSRAPVILANATSIAFELDRPDEAEQLFARHRFLLPPGRDGARRQVPAHCAGMALEAHQHNWRAAVYHCDRVARHPTWQWAELRANLILSEVAVFAARRAGRHDFARRAAEIALSASAAGGHRSERTRIRQAILDTDE